MIPQELAGSAFAGRLTVASAAVRGAGAALVELRGTISGKEADGGQLKTSTDLAAEGWVLGYLAGHFPEDEILAEERFDHAAKPWHAPRAYWTIDALDGTRSYVEGFAGFCTQVAYVVDGVPVLAAIYEPTKRTTYIAIANHGAWRVTDDVTTRLAAHPAQVMMPGARFVDSTRPRGPAGAMFDRYDCELVECGSVGLKLCRLAEARADVYAKQFTYKLWDVAPGEVLLREVGAQLGTWDGAPIDYAGTQTHYTGLLAAPRAYFAQLATELTSA
jgi:3'(2'), 5'-bisphosphate nucleotidase